MALGKRKCEQLGGWRPTSCPSRRASGEDWKTYLRGLAAEAGLEAPSDEDLRRFDKTRKDKKVANDDWTSPGDPDSRIARRKDGTTHMAYKAEHVVDLAPATESSQGDRLTQ